MSIVENLTGKTDCKICDGDGKCKRCKGSGLVKVNKKSGDQAIKSLMALAFASVGLADKTDKEIAESLQNIYNKLSICSMESSIVSEAIDRLNRANGGPMPREEDE